jgi:hypothetical protein
MTAMKQITKMKCIRRMNYMMMLECPRRLKDDNKINNNSEMKEDIET